MDLTLTIDRTWVLHFPDQLFNCYNISTVSHLDVKPVWSLSETAAFRRLIMHAVVALSCLLVCGLQASSATPPSLSTIPAGSCRQGAASTPPPTACLTHPPSHLPWHSAHTHTLHIYCAVDAIRTLILSYCCSPHSISVRIAAIGHKV